MASVSCHACSSPSFLSSFLVVVILDPFRKAGRWTHGRPLISWVHVFDYLVLSWWHCLGRLLDLCGAEPCWWKWVNVKTKLRFSSVSPPPVLAALWACHVWPASFLFTPWLCEENVIEQCYFYIVFFKNDTDVLLRVFLLLLFILLISKLSILYLGLWNKQKGKFTG